MIIRTILRLFAIGSLSTVGHTAPNGQSPEHMAMLSYASLDHIQWGEPNRGMTLGIEDIETSVTFPLSPVITIHLANQTDETISNLMRQRASFIVEIDGVMYGESSMGGAIGQLRPRETWGPYYLSTQYFKRIAPAKRGVHDPDAPALTLTSGHHILRVHFGHMNSVVSPPIAIEITMVPYPEAEAAIEFSQALRSSNQDRRRDAALRTGELRVRGAIPALIDTLADRDPTTRRYAATSLGQIGDRAASETALRQSLNDPSMEVVFAAAEALVSCGVPLDTAWIEPVIRSEESIFQNAIWLIRRHAGEAAVPALIRCLDPNDPKVSSYYNYTLVWQIGACGGPSYRFNHDFDGKGTPEQVEENRQTLSRLIALLSES
ncbi:HEAT repeat domain-containing protein [Actomonas aquatica]|uniref:HEAT repeat domain-containing protein n=1 Tax=Actomonas aquatica TaxID=2866162 RepID=A0ABZ1CCV1_9BACT|nr:HEAT repeat domain-containing protein [Opitutus sp. WL0086]WRQ89485.1 HEAT repeat domain-containing protein [Opitutus sp. WL0086]